MAWSRKKVDSATINGGNEYEKGSRVSRQGLNAMVNGGLYAQDFAEKLVADIDVSEIGNVGTPTVTLVSGTGATTDKPYKKFKFANFKGEKGETGATGATGPTGPTGPTGATPQISATATTLAAGSSATATVSGSAESPLITFGIPKGEKGDKGDKGESGEIYQTTGTSTTGAMSQNATTNELKAVQSYDLIIRTQEEFAAFTASITAGTCTARSVAFVGDGGTLTFTYSRTLTLPSTIVNICGINVPILGCSLSQTKDATLSNRYGYTIKNIRLKCGASGTDNNSFSGFQNMENCYASSFQSCHRLVNCYAFGNNTSNNGFKNCYKLTNCYARVDWSDGANQIMGFNTCVDLVNCEAHVESVGEGFGFSNCSRLANCASYGYGYLGGSGFIGCKNLTGCTSRGETQNTSETGYGYNSCKYCSSCSSDGTASTTSLWNNCTKVDTDSCED